MRQSAWINLVTTTALTVGVTITMPILQMWRPRHREVKECDKDHTAEQQQRFRPGGFASAPMILTAAALLVHVRVCLKVSS